MCARCELEAPHRHGEWQCLDCGAWWWASTTGQVRVYDRERTDETMTAHQQVQILVAVRKLEAQGSRFLRDFGWQNAERWAEALEGPQAGEECQRLARSGTVLSPYPNYAATTKSVLRAPWTRRQPRPGRETPH